MRGTVRFNLHTHLHLDSVPGLCRADGTRNQPGWTTQPEVSIRGNLLRVPACTAMTNNELREPEGQCQWNSASLIRTSPEEICALIVVITRIVFLVTQKTRTDSSMRPPLPLVSPDIQLIRRPLILGQRGRICLKCTRSPIRETPTHLRIPREWHKMGSPRLKSAEPDLTGQIPDKLQRQQCLPIGIAWFGLERDEPESPGSSTCVIGSCWRPCSHTLLSIQSRMASVRTAGLPATVCTSFPRCHW
jgi:hypothetical protein